MEESSLEIVSTHPLFRISLKRGSSGLSGLRGAGEGKTFLDSDSFSLLTSSSDKSDRFSEIGGGLWVSGLSHREEAD